MLQFNAYSNINSYSLDNFGTFKRNCIPANTNKKFPVAPCATDSRTFANAILSSANTRVREKRLGGNASILTQAHTCNLKIFFYLVFVLPFVLIDADTLACVCASDFTDVWFDKTSWGAQQIVHKHCPKMVIRLLTVIIFLCRIYLLKWQHLKVFFKGYEIFYHLKKIGANRSQKVWTIQL